jgi:menaquinone-dependent protoporphyrinogen oxidase
MRVLVAYASRHGATQGIAERIAETLRQAGLEAEALPAASVKKVTEYDALVIGGAAYMFHWLKDATKFVRRNRAFLATRPVWLFSSGPIGTEPTDAEGRDQKVVAIPREFAELVPAVKARDQQIFFGAVEPGRKPIGWTERMMLVIPAAKGALPVGDFRDWAAIEAWAATIARDLA